jgi:predicted nucleic acid-binding protein
MALRQWYFKFYGTVDCASCYAKANLYHFKSYGIWIAAIAFHHRLVVATRDRHFKESDTEKVRRW